MTAKNAETVEVEQTEAVEAEESGMKLVQADVPAGTVRGSSSKYRAILDQFKASGWASSRIESGANVSTLYQQLTKAIKADPEAYKGIKASKREGQVFLINV